MAVMIPEFYPDKPNGKLQVRCRISEGNMTVARKNGAFGTDIGYSFVSEAQGVDPNAGFFVGDKVVFDGIDDDGRIKVKKHVYNDGLPVVGEIMTKIDFVGVPTITPGTYTVGTFVPREATVLFYGKRIRTLSIYMAQSTNMTAGQYLVQNDVTGYEYAWTASASTGTTRTSRVAVAAATASSSAASVAKIPVLEGYE
jgi:hypothetical protein